LVGDALINRTGKFGNGSWFDGTGDYLTVLDSNDWNLDGQFTLDFWVRFSALPTLDGDAMYFVGGNGHKPFSFLWTQTTALGYNLEFYSASAGGPDIQKVWVSPAINTWYHLAVTRDASNNIRIFVDGTQIGTTENNTATYTQKDFAIGSYPQAGGYHELFGWIDEFRISKGVARWTANFTPPTKAYDTASDYTGQAIVITQ